MQTKPDKPAQYVRRSTEQWQGIMEVYESSVSLR